MKNIEITVQAGLDILEQFMTVKKIEPRDAKGLAAWSKKNIGQEGFKDLGEKYLSNLYYNWSEEVNKSKKVQVRTGIIIMNSICQELGCKDLEGFLVENRYLTKDHNFLPKGDINELRKLNPTEQEELIDKYFFGAQFIPSFIGVSPLAILLSVITYQFEGIPNYTIWIVLALFIGIVLAIADWNSLRGKAYETKHFKSEGKRGFPTTYLMLFSHQGVFNRVQKIEYREKIASYFDIILMSEEEEKNDENRALTLLSNAGIKVKDNIKSVRIRSRNIRYGRMRNLIPAIRLGALISSLSSLAGAVTYYFLGDVVLPTLSIALAITYWLSYWSILRQHLLRKAGEAFAEYLLNEFLSR